MGRSGAGSTLAHAAENRSKVVFFFRSRSADVAADTLTAHSRRVAAMDDSEINQAKMQVQGQMAAQYIQEVMQVNTARSPLHFRNLGKKSRRPVLRIHGAHPSLCLPSQVITTKCFAKCVTKPGPKLDDSEKICMAKCMDRCVQQRRRPARLLLRSRSPRS
jgi:hypothetical protein